MILLGKLDINGKHFTINDSDGTVYLKELGLPDNWYGGYVKELRKTKYGIYLCLNRKKEVVDLGYFEEGLTTEGLKLLLNKEETKETVIDRKALIAEAKELGIEGKLATLKTEVLIEKIREAKETK